MGMNYFFFLFNSEKNHITDVNVMRQSACLDFNPITINNYSNASLIALRWVGLY